MIPAERTGAGEESGEAAIPVSQSPRPAASSEGFGLSADDLTMEQDMAELRGLLHELLEMSLQIARRGGESALHAEVEVLERILRVWGADHIRWRR